MATVGARFVHDCTAPLAAWLAAIPIGMLVTAILVANNLRDLSTDAVAGKRTLAVVIGDRPTRALYAALVAGAFALVAVFGLAEWMPRGVLIAVPFALMARRPIQQVLDGAEGRSLIWVLKRTAATHLFLGLAIGAGAAIWH